MGVAGTCHEHPAEAVRVRCGSLWGAVIMGQGTASQSPLVWSSDPRGRCTSPYSLHKLAQVCFEDHQSGGGGWGVGWHSFQGEEKNACI